MGVRRLPSRAKVLPPSASAGTYELRLYGQNGWQRLAVSNAITVNPPALTASPATVAPGGALTVAWQGSGAAVTDWLALVPVGAPDSSYVAWGFATGRTTDATLFPIPAALVCPMLRCVASPGRPHARNLSGAFVNRRSMSNRCH